MKKIIAITLVLVMCVTVFFSCAGGNDYVIEIDGGKGVTVNFMYLLTAMNKTMYSSAVDGQSGGNWDTVVYPDENITWADLLRQVVIEDTENFLICEYLFDKVYSLKLSKEDEKLIEDEYNSYVDVAGSKESFDEIMSQYSADKNTFKRYLELTVKQLVLQDYLYGLDGVKKIPDEQVRDNFADNYVVVTHIYFNTVTKQTADGKLISLSEEEAAQKIAVANSVMNALSAGEDFDTLKAQYSEDAYESVYYPNGFFVTNDNTFPTPFTTAALEMKEGEYRLVDSGNGLHILYKKPMDESLYNTNPEIYNKIYSRLIALDFNRVIEENLDKIIVKDESVEMIEAINVQNVPAFALFPQYEQPISAN